MEIGQLIVEYSGNEHGFLEDGEDNSVPLVTAEAVGQEGVFNRAWGWVCRGLREYREPLLSQ